MENEPPHAYEQEISVLLRTLRVEATPEAHFEERFLYDFRERLAREAVCRPARTLLWEHLLMAFSNFGGRRLAFGASSFGLGALFIGVLTWYQGTPVPRAVAEHVCELGESAAFMRPGASQGVVCTSVSRRARRSSYTENAMDMQGGDVEYFAVADDADPQSLYGAPGDAGMYWASPDISSSFSH